MKHVSVKHVYYEISWTEMSNMSNCLIDSQCRVKRGFRSLSQRVGTQQTLICKISATLKAGGKAWIVAGFCKPNVRQAHALFRSNALHVEKMYYSREK